MVKKFTWNKIKYCNHKECYRCFYYHAYYGKEELGYIDYYPKWKKWVWNQGENIIMSISCLREVVKKLRTLEEQKR